MRFEGVDDRTAAEALPGVESLAGRSPLDVELDDDELWVHELIGAEVRDRAGTVLGRVVAVEANPAHDLLVLDGGALSRWCSSSSSATGVVVVDPPDGLFDL